MWRISSFAWRMFVWLPIFRRTTTALVRDVAVKAMIVGIDPPRLVDEAVLLYDTLKAETTAVEAGRHCTEVLQGTNDLCFVPVLAVSKPFE